MDSFLGTSTLGFLLSLFIGQADLINDSTYNIDKQVAYYGASYSAEASVEKQLLAIKTDDTNQINLYTQKMTSGLSEDLQYGTMNKYGDTGYFNVALKNTTEDELNLGDIKGGDFVIKNVSNEDYFNQFILNYDKGSSNNGLEITIIRFNKNNGGTCDFYDIKDDNCSGMIKNVINTSDSRDSGKVENGIQTNFNSGENGFNNQISISGLMPNNYDYRITFNTIGGSYTNMSYKTKYNGTDKKLVNNVIEIDVIGTAVNNYSRTKLQKKITNDMQPLSKYVLFSDGEVAK